MKVFIKIFRHEKDYNHVLETLCHKKGDIDEIREDSIAFCCEKMKEAYYENFLFFGKEGGSNKDKNINIYKYYCYPEGTSVEEMAIEFCPFCAAKIEIIENE